MPEVTGPLCHSSKATTDINLSWLPEDKKAKVWKLLKSENPALASLLSSAQFQRDKEKLEQYFGPVELHVESRQLGGTEYGIRQRLKEQD